MTGVWVVTCKLNNAVVGCFSTLGLAINSVTVHKLDSSGLVIEFYALNEVFG